MQWILQIPALFFSVIFHEFMHGYMAYRKGDDTAYLSGRLTFNPIAHIDPIGTLLLPVLAAISNMPVIGWAKPVPVNPYRMNNPRTDMVWVAAAGPVSNFSLALFSAALYKFLILSGFYNIAFFLPLIYIFKFMIYINLALCFFNLIPVYPLDGSQIVLGILPYKWLIIYERHLPYGFYLILFFVLTGMVKYFIIWPMDFSLKLFNLIGLGV